LGRKEWHVNEERPDAISGLAAEPEAGERDLFRLVLTVVDLSGQLMERQVARDDAGELSEEQREALTLALLRLEEAIEGFRRHHGLPISDLEIDLDTLAPRLPEGGTPKRHGG
jgi:Gas vesicle protein K